MNNRCNNKLFDYSLHVLGIKYYPRIPIPAPAAANTSGGWSGGVRVYFEIPSKVIQTISEDDVIHTHLIQLRSSSKYPTLIANDYRLFKMYRKIPTPHKDKSWSKKSIFNNHNKKHMSQDRTGK